MTNWYNKNPEIDIRFVNLGSFSKEVERELMKNAGVGSAITIGVQERPYYGRIRTESNRGLVGTKTRKTKLYGKPKVVSTSMIAAGHEFGLSNLPRRSFLELSARKFVKSNLQKIADRNYTYIKSFLKALTVKLYDMIIDCFFTSGWGSWKLLTDDYMKRTGRSNPPLIDTGQLMSAVYAQYEGFTVSGKQVGGFAQSDFFNIADDGTTTKDKKDILKEAARLKAQMEQIKATREQVTVKAEKAKKKVEVSREEIIEKLYAKKKKELGHIGFLSWIGDEESEIDVMSTEEIRKRYGV